MSDGENVPVRLDEYTVLFEEVVGLHINDALITGDGLIDIGKVNLSSRLGYEGLWGYRTRSDLDNEISASDG